MTVVPAERRAASNTIAQAQSEVERAREIALANREARERAERDAAEARRRAESVAAELEAKGVPSSEIEIVAKGKRDLLVPTADGVREPQNRRVQIVFGGGPTS